jgi:hypothetical protein
MDDLRFLAVTKQEAELLMDSFRLSNPLTRDLALKAASLVLEFDAEDSSAPLLSSVSTYSTSGGDDCYLGA